jgi:histidinol-phosphate aminotransferase
MRNTLKDIDRPHWSGLAERVSKIDTGYLSLDRNENLDEIYIAQIVDILKNKIDLSKFNRYADYYNYYNQLSDFFNISTDNMIITGGCDEAIRLSFEACINPGDNYLRIDPTYRGAECNVADLGVTHHIVDQDENNIITALKKYKPTVFYICSPNNPTGKVYSTTFIETICKMFPDTIMFIDNTYADYTDVCYHDFLTYKNCIIAKSFSKIWGLAGMRMGLILGHKEIIDEISKIRPVMSVSAITLELVSYLINNYSIVEDTIKRNKAGIDYLYKYFSRCQIYSEPYINHIIFDPPTGLIDKLNSQKLLYPAMKNYSIWAIKLTTMPIGQCLSIFK